VEFIRSHLQLTERRCRGSMPGARHTSDAYDAGEAGAASAPEWQMDQRHVSPAIGNERRALPVARLAPNLVEVAGAQRRRHSRSL
jgi:hypothetical protein